MKEDLEPPPMEDLGFSAEVSMNFRRRDLVVSVAIAFNSIFAQDIGRAAQCLLQVYKM